MAHVVFALFSEEIKDLQLSSVSQLLLFWLLSDEVGLVSGGVNSIFFFKVRLLEPLLPSPGAGSPKDCRWGLSPASPAAPTCCAAAGILPSCSLPCSRCVRADIRVRAGHWNANASALTRRWCCAAGKHWEGCGVPVVWKEIVKKTTVRETKNVTLSLCY